MTLHTIKRQSFLKSIADIFNRKTVKGFASRIHSFGELDAGMQAAFQPYLDPADPIVDLLFAPAQSVVGERPEQMAKWWPKGWLPWQITPEYTLLLTARQLLIASTARTAGGSREAPLVGEENEQPAPGDGVEPIEVVRIAMEDVVYLETAFILLTSWFEIRWAEGSKLQRVCIHFNTVCRELFEALARSMRESIRSELPAWDGDAPSGLERLAGMPYKFRNLIPLRLLLPDEPVVGAIFRPSMWVRDLYYFHRHTASKMALVRTADNLILVQEDLTAAEDAYGLIAQILPLRSIQGAAVAKTDKTLEVTLHLSWHGAACSLERSFQPSQRADVMNLLQPWLLNSKI